MIPIKQTQKQGKEKRGNSMTACFASFLDLKLKECPALQDMDYPEVVEWTEEQGYEIEKAKNDPYERLDVSEGDFYIAFGVSPREEDEFQHFVVMQSGEMFHDPHLSGDGLKEVEGYMYFEKIYDELPTPEPEKPEKLKEELDINDFVEELPEDGNNEHTKIDEKFLELMGFVFTKADSYTGRGLFKLMLIKTPIAEVTISAQRLSSIKNHPDTDAWVLIYNEIGQGNSRIGKKMYFKRQALKFVEFFKWTNNIQ